MAQQYWVKQQADGDEHGPYSADDLHQFVRAGIVALETLISLDRAAWYYADEIENLIPAATEPAVVHADANATPVDLQPSVEAEAPAAASAATRIDYFNSSASHAVPLRRPLTPERPFQGVFTYLHICAIALGLIILGIGANIGSSVLKTYDSRDLDVPIETIGWLAGFGLTAVLLIAAGGLGFVQGRAERLLFVAAVAFVVLRIMNGTMGLMIQRYQWGMSQRAVPIGQRKKAEWRIAAIALAMSLCIWIGGLIAWFSRWIGQTLLLFGAIGMTLFLLSAAASLTRKAPAAQLTAVLEEAGSLIIFLLFGTFALIRGGIANMGDEKTSINLALLA